jgi:pimeloyl-ACP methyl ester carboxylesterase
MFTDQLHPFLTPSAEPVRHDVVHDGQRIPLQFRHGGPQARTLFITFHGAVDRKTREVPSFLGFFADLKNKAHQLNVSDPAMLRDGEHAISWYAGHKGLHLQKILPVLFRNLQTALDIDRVVFLGSSGGGFAALFYGWQHPGSVVLAANPQTDLTKYYKFGVDAYRAGCWPDLPLDADLSQVVTTDVGSLYAQKVPSTVIYVQSAMDPFHLGQHMAPFLAQVPGGKNIPMTFHVDYFGATGHSFSFVTLLPWIRAILLAPDTGLQGILDARARLEAAGSMATQGRPLTQKLTSRLGKSAPASDADPRIPMADMLRDIALKGH